MKIVKPFDGAVAAERRLVSIMLCIEHGAAAFGPDMAPLPPPHRPWPVISVPPVTTRGLATTVHYRPTVGVVFYTAGEGFDVKQLVTRVSAALAKVSDAHLKTHRATATTPAVVVRHANRVAGGNLVVGPKKCFRKPAGAAADYPARLLMWTPPADRDLPPHYSIRAAFTWVFMPITAALDVRTFASMSEVNALVASAFYDGAMISRHADGSEIFKMAIEDFDFPRAPESVGAEPAGPKGKGALFVHPGTARVEYVGCHTNLACRQGRPFAQLPARPWNPDDLVLRAPGRFQCCCCDAPAAGDALVLFGLRVPASHGHREWFMFASRQGSPILHGENENKGLLLCVRCWDALESPACIATHMAGRVERTVVPLTQAQACASIPEYRDLAPILDGVVSPVPNIAGAFTVQTAQGSVVLAGAMLGPYPALVVPEVSALRLPVLAGLRIAEAQRERWAAPARQ